MSTLTNTYETLDKKLETGIIELREISVGKVHTMMTELENKFLGLDFSALSKLRDMANKVGNLVDLVMGAPKRIIDAVTKIINDVVNRIMGSKIAGWIGDLFGMLKNLSEKGVKDFLLGELGSGNLGMCDNSDVLQAYLNGIYIPENIMQGIFADLALSWGNRVCKNATRSQEQSSSNRDVLDLLSPYGGSETTRESVFGDFTSIASGYYEYAKDLFKFRAVTFSGVNYLETIYKTDIEKFREAVIDIPLSKDEKLAIVTNALDNPDPDNEPEDALQRLLDAREIILELPTYSRSEVIKATNLPRAKDALGTFFKNMSEIDFDRVSQAGMIAEEKEILKKLRTLQKSTNIVDFKARGTTSGSFHNYDFTEVLSIFTPEEVDYIRSQPIDLRTHRYNNMHPTAEVFIDDDLGRLKKRDAVKSNQVFGA